jgi:phenol 2-monooxygenase (NADPH)
LFCVAVDYGASVIVAKSGNTEDQGDGTDVSVSDRYRVVSKQELAPGIEVGKRMPSAKVLNQADARPWHFQELLPSNGRWRVVVFAGDISKPDQKKRIDAVGAAIDDKNSFLRQYTPAGAKPDSVIELLGVHSAPRATSTIFDMPEVFRPYDEVDGWDYWKIFVDDESYHEGHGKIYETFNISPEGCAVIIRPDQYVSFVGPMDDVHAINRFFAGFMIPAKGAVNGGRTSAKPVPVANGVPLNKKGDAIGAATAGAAVAL